MATWLSLLVCVLLFLLKAEGITVGITYLQSVVAKGAVCLDGSPPAYHFDKGFGAGINNWIVHFEVLSDWTYIFASSLTILILIYIAGKRSVGSSISFEGEPNSIRAYITSYRVIVMIITFLCILVVDFRIFPRRYAKTETYGASLENQELLIKSISQDLGFSGGKPIAACVVYKCLLHWRSFEVERTSVFDRIIQTIALVVEAPDDSSEASYDAQHNRSNQSEK